MPPQPPPPMTPDLAAEDHYFGSNPPPKGLAAHEALARAFIDSHRAAGRRVVLVTSGGTTVPLERQTVRFIDNFSAGTRGATSAECFLEAGYAVVFLHRQFSLLPYSRHYSHTPTACFLDFLHEEEEGSSQDGDGAGTGTGTGTGRVVANPEHAARMLGVLRKYRAARQGDLLLMLPFVTITDYLYELRAVARLMRPLGPRGLLYLAAAVSDFFVPPERMAEHKIQSTNALDPDPGAAAAAAPPAAKKRKQDQAAAAAAAAAGGEPPLPDDDDGAQDPTAAAADDGETFDNFDSSPRVPRSKRLVVDLDPVPKFLKNLVDGWAPQGMIVSFKLETDPAILVHKARYSLDRYQHHLVIGNLLATRKWEVVFVAPACPDRWIRLPTAAAAAAAGSQATSASEERPIDPAALPDGDPDLEIESLIIPAVQELHSRHMESYQSRAMDTTAA
ncbi:phosphopantothenate-cysteine ligase [Gaeumannomyces tritici R3-111a-1]|uniref:Phosphopantothenate-cysteine ligase n=1 Tax=Gaeumannomyces tritici (strain R3-111a-1) TaxID=644352 RepID=J3PDN2_GAET3|nr:phosphopantothenate-cysteine ligase [Gaeumannomyces tritici R3-111a-1]EJT70582.1 phosphopantothenate-cysteine ligase [Gaeumannomyces tritici R3-111a-1]